MNVKAGDLAIVVNIRPFPENNGMIVKVVRRSVCACGCIGWECHSDGRPFVGAVGGLFITSGPDAVVDDANLRPVSGLALEVDADQVVEAAVAA